MQAFEAEWFTKIPNFTITPRYNGASVGKCEKLRRPREEVKQWVQKFTAAAVFLLSFPCTSGHLPTQ